MIRNRQSKWKISSFQYTNERIDNANNSENGSSFLNYLKWLFTVPVRCRFQLQETEKNRFRFGFDSKRSVLVRFQKIGSSSVFGSIFLEPPYPILGPLNLRNFGFYSFLYPPIETQVIIRSNLKEFFIRSVISLLPTAR